MLEWSSGALATCGKYLQVSISVCLWRICSLHGSLCLWGGYALYMALCVFEEDMLSTWLFRCLSLCLCRRYALYLALLAHLPSDSGSSSLLLLLLPSQAVLLHLQGTLQLPQLRLNEHTHTHTHTHIHVHTDTQAHTQTHTHTHTHTYTARTARIYMSCGNFMSDQWRSMSYTASKGNVMVCVNKWISVLLLTCIVCEVASQYNIFSNSSLIFVECFPYQ